MDHVLVISLLSGLAALGTSFGLGWTLGHSRAQNWWWNEMIRRRHAEYHWEDGKIYWNADLPKTSRDPAASQAMQLMKRAEMEKARAARTT